MNSLEIKKIREEMGLNVREFAELVKMDRRSVANWESGKAKMPDAKAQLVEFLLEKFRNGTVKAVEVIDTKSVDNLNREVLDLKDHIQTLKDMLDMVKRENVFLKEKLDNAGKDVSG